MSHKSEMDDPFNRCDTIINKHFTFTFTFYSAYVSNNLKDQ